MSVYHAATVRLASDRFVWLAHVCGANFRITGLSIDTSSKHLKTLLFPASRGRGTL